MIAKAGVIQPPLFFYLPSLEQTSHNKLHDIWILRMQSVSRTIKELQPRLQPRRRLHCLIPLKGTGGLVSQTRNGYLKPGDRAWYQSLLLTTLILFDWMLT